MSEPSLGPLPAVAVDRAAAPIATLLVAATGGHLEELTRLQHRLVPAIERTEWVTFADPQATSILAGECVHMVPYVPPRGYRAAALNLRTAFRVLRNGHFDRVVSTGSGIAVPYFLAARSLGIPCHYIESAARTDGPSLTGRLVSRIPGVRVYTQYPEWAKRRWAFRGSLFDDYEPGLDMVGDAPARRVVVTLGTMRTYGFGRAVQRLRAVLPEVCAPGAEVLWQVGTTDVAGLGIDARDRMPAVELHSAMAEADLVIAHAGIGSALTALDVGKCPVLLPRRRAYGEHVDDHQQMIANRLQSRGLSVSTEVDHLTADLCRKAMVIRVAKKSRPGNFALI